MKIVHVTSAHSRNSTRIFHKMAMSSVNLGHEVSLVVADGKGDSSERSVSFYDVGQYVNKYIRFFVSSLKVILKAKSLNADVYHMHDPDLLLWAFLLRSPDNKVFFDAHEDYPLQILHKNYIPESLRKPLSLVFEVTQNFICRRLSGVVTATPFIKSKFDRYVDRTIDVKNYPLQSEFRTELVIEAKVAQNSFIVSYVGGITTVRGIEEVVKAFELLDDHFSLQVAGRFLESNLQDRLELMNGWAKVSYKGFLSRRKVVDLLADSNCGIVTLHPIKNYIDALPIKMFEYMAVGIPVIASDFPLLRTIIEKYDCGVLVDPLDPVSISEAVRFLFENPDRAKEMGRNGQSAVSTSLNFENESRLLNKFYES